ncbi:hypothetical protein VWM78_09760, partial [Campylobacter coli]
FVQMRNLNNTLNKTIQEKTTQLDQLQSKLSFQTQYGTAKQRMEFIEASMTFILINFLLISFF